MADPESLIPRARGAVDAARMRAMPLAPIDGFILSRIDGTSSVADLAGAMSLPVEEVTASVRKLESLGLIELPNARASREATVTTTRSGPFARTDVQARGPAGAAVRSAQPAIAASPTQDTSGSAETARVSAVLPRDASSGTRGASPTAPHEATTPLKRGTVPSSPPSAVAEPRAAFTSVPGLDLAPEHQERIATLFARIDRIDHYEVLGVERGADKKAIKRAYFDLTARFHPDRFFRKNLGPFKAQMEAIFGRMTEAHDTLTDGERRDAYDAYIGSLERTRTIEQKVAEAAAEMRRAEETVLRAPVSSIPPPQGVVAAVTGGSAQASPPPTPARIPSRGALTFPKEPATGVSGRTSSVDVKALGEDPGDRRSQSFGRIAVSSLDSARRDALAQRLTGRNGAAPLKDPPPAGPLPTAPSRPEEAVDTLKRRYEDKMAAARRQQARKYADGGLEALAKGDVIAAANALRMALSFDGDNAELKLAYDKAQRASDQLLGEQYLKQAEYEEKAEKWADAARSWRRVARAREDEPGPHERAAACLVKAAGNLHEAAALAQRAVKLAPKSAPVRVTLANVYLAAGLHLNAKRELEVAAQLAPADAAIASLLKRVKTSD